MEKKRNRNQKSDRSYLKTTVASHRSSGRSPSGNDDPTVLVTNKFREGQRGVSFDFKRRDYKKRMEKPSQKKSSRHNVYELYPKARVSNQQKHKAAGLRTLKLIKLNANQSRRRRKAKTLQSLMTIVLMMTLVAGSGFITYRFASAWFQNKTVDVASLISFQGLKNRSHGNSNSSHAVSHRKVNYSNGGRQVTASTRIHNQAVKPGTRQPRVHTLPVNRPGQVRRNIGRRLEAPTKSVRPGQMRYHRS